MIYTLLLTPGGWHYWEFSVGFSESRPYFRPKNVIFDTHFQNGSLKSILIFVASHADVLRGSSRVSAPQTGTHDEPLRMSACEASPDSWGDSPVFSRVIFVFAFSIQRTQLNYLGAWNRLGVIRKKLCHHYQVKAKTTNILQVHFEFAYFYFILVHLELKR